MSGSVPHNTLICGLRGYYFSSESLGGKQRGQIGKSDNRYWSKLLLLSHPRLFPPVSTFVISGIFISHHAPQLKALGVEAFQCGLDRLDNQFAVSGFKERGYL